MVDVNIDLHHSRTYRLIDGLTANWFMCIFIGAKSMMLRTVNDIGLEQAETWA
jgi:hypothetical protein